MGMLMQAYRRAYQATGKRGRLSQEGLLHLMGEVDPRYLERYNHSTVARWESGVTRPSRERLEVFGKALNLPRAEVDGMIWLAGLDGNSDTIEPGARAEYQRDPDAHDPEVSPPKAATPVETTTHSYAGQLIYYALSRFVLPGLVVAGTGYMLTRLGWNAGWILVLYVILAIVLVLVQGFLRMRRTIELRELYFVTVFVLISGNLLLAPAIRMDAYGFYAIADFANTPMPFLLSLLANLLLALAAGLMFDFLWRWQYSGQGGFNNVYQRAAWTSFLPLMFVYGCALLFCCVGSWIYLLFVFSVAGGTFMAMLILRDREMEFHGWERKFLLQAAIAVILVLTAVGSATILILYLRPSMLAIPDHTLIRSWEIDFSALGYSADELLERYRFGAIWSSLAMLVYMVIVLGGNLMATIYRLDTNDADQGGKVDGSSHLEFGSDNLLPDGGRLEAHIHNGP